MVSLGTWDAIGGVAFDLDKHSDDLKKSKLLESETGKWTCLRNNLRSRTASVWLFGGKETLKLIDISGLGS